VIELQNVSVKYANPITSVLNNVSLNVEKGEVFALMGGSGSGKTTILNLLSANLKEYDNIGAIKISGIDVTEGISALKIGYVKQQPKHLLFNWLTVSDNVALALKLRKELSGTAISILVDEMLDEFGLSHRKKSFPYTLSGGEAKRLSLAMVLAYKPILLLLDEPSAGLDLELVQNLWDTLYAYFKTNKTTSIIVTHSFDEAALLADRVAFITQQKGLYNCDLAAKDFKIPQTAPRFLLLNHPNVVSYKQYLLDNFTKAVND
jgi:putrescine transport system ATP-binding protein